MRKILYITVLFFCMAFFSSCRKDKLLVNSSAKLTFTTDSILFDTVFTSIGSTTQLFRVHNNNNGTVNISSIRLARGNSSFYSLNVDGTPGKSFSNIEIAAHDSIYVFVKVTIDPNADPSVSPFIYRDSILFETNGNHQDVKLVAFGQNAYYHMPTDKIIISNTQALYYSVDTNYNGAYCHTWPSDKPHLIYGYYVIDSLHTLTIQQGTKIYMHNNAGIWVYRGGCIQIKGALHNEVIIQGDRREPEYKDVPGQWDRIWINEGSTGNCKTENIIDYAIIKNGFIGVHAGYSVLDGYGGNTVNTSTLVPKHLSLTNTKIQNCSFAGILGRFFNITGGNDVVSNCGKYMTAFQYGGNYSFTQCTFANYWSQTNNSNNGSQSRTTSAYLFNNYIDASSTLPFDSLFFANCILDGNLDEEIQFDTLAGGFSNRSRFKFDACLIKTQTSLNPLSVFQNCLKSTLSSNPSSFKDVSGYDFHINANSAAHGTGSSNYPNWPVDIENNSRTSPIDMGAYIYQ
ncbi:MAG: hypothetical protein ACXVPN_14645 [Bacteroidia bacterium]